MSWLNFFQTTSTCDVSFGRGINASINPDEEELFNKSYQAFEQKNTLDAYAYFFESLINFTNDVSNENIIMKRIDDIDIVAAFDIDKNKVGKDLSEAIFTAPNNTIKFADVPKTGVIVDSMGTSKKIWF